jgi:flagellar protein FliO/FliZ
VLALFGVLALGLKKILLSDNHALGKNSKILGAVSRFAQKSLGKDRRMVEVVSTHHLGPKKSIAIVKIAGRTMVLGVSNESINLITHLSDGDTSWDEAAVQAEEENFALPNIPNGTGAIAAGPSVFSSLLQSETTKPKLPGQKAPLTPVAGPSKPMASNGIRSQIRSRLEGLKPL